MHISRAMHIRLRFRSSYLVSRQFVADRMTAAKADQTFDLGVIKTCKFTTLLRYCMSSEIIGNLTEFISQAMNSSSIISSNLGILTAKNNSSKAEYERLGFKHSNLPSQPNAIFSYSGTNPGSNTDADGENFVLR